MTPPLPQVIARREVELPLRRTLEVTAIEDGSGHLDTWLRVRTASGQIAGTIHCAPIALRRIADALNAIAAEVGVEP